MMVFTGSERLELDDAVYEPYAGPRTVRYFVDEHHEHVKRAPHLFRPAGAADGVRSSGARDLLRARKGDVVLAGVGGYTEPTTRPTSSFGR